MLVAATVMMSAASFGVIVMPAPGTSVAATRSRISSSRSAVFTLLSSAACNPAMSATDRITVPVFPLTENTAPVPDPPVGSTTGRHNPPGWS